MGRIRRRSPWLAGAVAVLAVTGCTTGGTPMSSAPSNPTPFRSASPLPGSPGGTGSAGTSTDVPPKRWAAILGDLTARGIPTDAVTLVSATSVTWNDGSLGCPKPGQSYTQSLIEGMKVVVKVGATQYDYRFGMSDNPQLCTK